MPTHSDSELERPLAHRSPLVSRERDVPASSAAAAFPDLAANPLPGGWSPPRAPFLYEFTPSSPPIDEGGTIPLHQPPSPTSVATLDVPTAIHTLLTCIDMCVAIMSMYITSTDARAGVLPQRKKWRVGLEVSGQEMAHMASTRRDTEEEELEDPHAKQVLDLIAWHVGVLGAR